MPDNEEALKDNITHNTIVINLGSQNEHHVR